MTNSEFHHLKDALSVLAVLAMLAFILALEVSTL
jgi:hypothetical protein